MSSASGREKEAEKEEEEYGEKEACGVVEDNKGEKEEGDAGILLGLPFPSGS